MDIQSFARRSVASGIALAGLAGLATAQSTAAASRISAPVRDAGLYRPDTMTWQRNTARAGSTNVIYNNTAPSGYYYAQGPDETIFGEGRVPSLDSEGTADTYVVTGFQIAYCTDDLLAVSVDAAWYEVYDACSGPTAGPVGSYVGVASSLPGTPITGTQACWVIAIDLAAADRSFVLNADNTATFDNVPARDNFGWSLAIKNLSQGANNTGLLIAGDPNDAPYGAGTYPLWGFAPGPEGTGLGELDQFYLEDLTNNSIAGCYWFGGYPQTGIWAGHWHQMWSKIGDTLECVDATDGSLQGTGVYCTSAPTSNGASTIDATPLEVSFSSNAPQLTLTADNLPVLNGQCQPGPQPGVFIAGSAKAAIPFFNGTMCIEPMGLQQLNPVLLPDATGTVQLDVDLDTQAKSGSGIGLPINVAIGFQHHFQYWTRDPCAALQGAPTTANFSSAIGVCIAP